MSEIESRLEHLGISLPAEPVPIANYVPGVRTGNLLYLSGLGPASRADGAAPSGKVGRDLTTEEGYEAARLTGINILARMKGIAGRSGQSAPSGEAARHGQQRTRTSTSSPPSSTAARICLVEVFGEKGRHARSAIGMASLPNDIPVEIEVIIEVED